MPEERALSGFLGQGATFEGDLAFDGRVRLDGTFRGRLRTADVLEIGARGRVEGEVDARELRLAGSVAGAVRVRDLLVIEHTGRVEGEVSAGRLEVHPGAHIDATLKVGL